MSAVNKRFIREFREKRLLYVEPAILIGGVQGHAGFAGSLQEGEP